MNTPIMMGAYGASAEATCNHAELLQQLHSDKQRLEEELERALMRPLHDESEDRINISHKIWLIQQSELKRLDDYKIRFYVAVFALILILAKLLIAFH